MNGAPPPPPLRRPGDQDLMTAAAGVPTQTAARPQVLYVVRHGESEYNAASRLAQNFHDPQIFDPKLTEKGRRQARARLRRVRPRCARAQPDAVQCDPVRSWGRGQRLRRRWLYPFAEASSND